MFQKKKGQGHNLVRMAYFTMRLVPLWHRGNGQDLGEFDILLINGRDIAFAEMITSLNNTKEMVEELDYKRRLLSAYFSAKVQSILISCIDLKVKSNLAVSIKSKRSLFVLTGGMGRKSCRQLRLKLLVSTYAMTLGLFPLCYPN